MRDPKRLPQARGQPVVVIWLPNWVLAAVPAAVLRLHRIPLLLSEAKEPQGTE